MPFRTGEPERQFSSCPTCGQAFQIDATEAMPFCSVRCRQVDLGRWFNEEIGLPLNPELDEAESFGEDGQYPG